MDSCKRLQQNGPSSLTETDIVEYKEVRKVHIQAACDEFTTVGRSGKLAADVNINFLLTGWTF